MLLFLSVFALYLGPITYRLLQRQPSWLDLLDSFIFVTISGLVLFHILPELLHSGGIFVLVLMALGLFVPSWIEKYFHSVAHQAHQTTLFLGVFGLVLHASIDGSALIVASGDHTGWLLAIGVLLHRFPVGLTIWWLLRPQYGKKLPLIILSCMAIATLVGALFSQSSIGHLNDMWLTWFQAFVMGSILHVVIHRPYLHSHKHDEKVKEDKYVAGIGSLLGLIVLAAILLPHWLGYIEHNHGPEKQAIEHNHAKELHAHDEDEHHHATELHDHGADEYHHATEPHDHEADEHHHATELHDHGADEQHHATEPHDHEADEHHHATESHDHEADAHEYKTALTLTRLSNLALKTAPFLLLAYFFSALMHYFKPQFLHPPTQQSKHYFKDSVQGVLRGLPLPVCSPTATKMHQTFLGQGANQTFATAFLIATPIIGFDAILISLPLLGDQLLLIRLAVAVTFAITIAWLLGRYFNKVIIPAKEMHCQHLASSSKIISAIKQGYQHQLDHTAPWVLLGWALAATLSATSEWGFFDQALWLQIIVMIIIAFPFALCATGVTPIIAVLLWEGLSPGAGIAFLLIAPTISLELLQKLKDQQGFFAAASLALAMFLGAFIIGLVLNQYIDVTPLTWLEQYSEGYHWWEYVSLLLISLLYLGSLLRRGARSFIAELIPKSFLQHKHTH